jgi:curli production assembly/transport component CsgG
VTLGVQEGIELAVYSLIFEGTKAGLWQFQDVAAGQQFMSYLQEHQRAMLVQDASQRPLAQTNPPAKANQPAAAKSAVGS